MLFGSKLSSCCSLCLSGCWLQGSEPLGAAVLQRSAEVQRGAQPGWEPRLVLGSHGAVLPSGAGLCGAWNHLQQTGRHNLIDTEHLIPCLGVAAPCRSVICPEGEELMLRLLPLLFPWLSALCADPYEERALSCAQR